MNRVSPVHARLASVLWTPSKIEISKTSRVRVKNPLSQISFASLRAAIPTARNRTTASRLAILNQEPATILNQSCSEEN